MIPLYLNALENAMNTPRLRSAFPSISGSDAKTSKQYAATSGAQGISSPLPEMTKPSDDANAPLIPYNVLDAPTQRLYILGFYIAFTTWRFYDYLKLVSDETDSLWLFMKWVAMDSIFLYGLPGMRVPWLQWSSSTMTLLFVLHAVMNAFLMFRIPIPFEAWLVAFTKLLYDRELAVSERRVKPASILHNSSLILGKQIVHILPEGSAMLNPDQTPFCVGSSRSSVNLPIRINQTNPILIELLRVDLDTNINETITIARKEISKLKKRAEREIFRKDRTSSLQLQYPVKVTGLYRLQRVVDESKLEVQRRLSDTLVVQCPKAFVKSVGQDKCKGDLSDFYLQVEGTPPFKIKYSKTINKENTGKATLSIHPDNFVSPLVRQKTSGALVTLDPSVSMDVSWARAQTIQNSLNESLGVSGGWRYSIDEVQDACGNIVKYSSSISDEPNQYKHPTSSPLEQILSVHERPRVALLGCDSQHPIKIAKGKLTSLPMQFSTTGSSRPEDSPYTISYRFTPQDKILPNQQHAKDTTSMGITVKKCDRGIGIVEPGLYTLLSVGNEWCCGEVLEPSSCLLINPPEPDLEIRSEDIPDRCAGNSIGLLVDLDLTGTPPFRVGYTVRRGDEKHTEKRVEIIEHLHTQLVLKPERAGHYTYEFNRINDAVYAEARPLVSEKFKLQQDVKPPALARFMGAEPKIKACIEEPVSLGIHLSGEPPWTLEYEVVHNGRRKRHAVSDLQSKDYQLTTEKLMKGGEYILALTGVTDRSRCKISLQEEAKIDVGLQRPRASFGQLEGKRQVLALEGKRINLPLKLQGDTFWVVSYRNLNDPQDRIVSKKLSHSNDQIEVDTEGTYELVYVSDATCPGSVDENAAKFEVRWIPRPDMDVAESTLVTKAEFGCKYVKKDVCEDDEDATEILFIGTPPFAFEYNQHFKPDHGPQAMSVKKFTAGLKIDSLKMETSHSGLYEYRFTKLSDGFYSHDTRKFGPLSIKQRVHPKPSARFGEAGKTYKYCKEEEAGDEVIPITLTGFAPFHLEIEIKHHATTKPELMNIPNIGSKQYNFHIPHRVLALGTHAVTIRKVRDSRGCQRKMDFDAAHVQVSVADIPSISPIEAQANYCVGDRISYTLSGMPPFNVFYTFQGRDRKASAPTTNFRRLAEKPGEFTITGISDQRSTDACKARVEITKVIHEMPSVRVSKGRTATVDIHEGGEAEILFEFGGTPPFEFIYTRSTNPTKGKKSVVQETKSEISHDYAMTIRASDEGVYEVVSIKDKYCAFSSQMVQGKAGQKLLTYRGT